MERLKSTIRSSIRSGVVVSLAILLALLGHDVGMAVAVSHGSASPAHVEAGHTQQASDSDVGHPDSQDDCRADDHASAMAWQSRPDLPTVASDMCDPSLAPSESLTVMPASAPPIASAERRVMLQVFLN